VVREVAGRPVVVDIVEITPEQVEWEEWVAYGGGNLSVLPAPPSGPGG
jgi:hypothetical protein